MNRRGAQLLGFVLLAGAYAWQGLSNGWLHWGAIACAVLFLLNLISMFTSKDAPP